MMKPFAGMIFAVSGLFMLPTAVVADEMLLLQCPTQQDALVAVGVLHGLTMAESEIDSLLVASWRAMRTVMTTCDEILELTLPAQGGGEVVTIGHFSITAVCYTYVVTEE